MAETFDELLKRLSEVKRLPAPEKPYRTQQAAVGSDLRDTARSAFAGTPRLADAIRDIQQGGSAATGPKGLLASALNSAPAKALFGGLTVIDTPRRAVISTIKEVGDALDSDPNTKFSGSDWRSQVGDPTFGFGRVAPGKGWGGRLVGFIGDVALDPVTYLTFGASVPLKAGASAQRLLAQGATKTLFRKSVSISGREGRFALARAAKQMGASDDIVRNVAARGKSALTPELASKLGVRRNGLYMFGSRVRIKGTGRIGDYLERGLIGSRLGLTNTKVGKKLQYLYTPRGSGTMGDLSTWRADVASGRLAPERVKMIVSALSGAEDARTLGAVARADELRRVAGLFDNDVEMQQFAADLHRFIEKPESSVLSVGQQAARKKVEDYLDDVATRIEQMMGEIEPGWKFNRVQRYVPHILTERARNAIDARADTPWAQFLEKYMSVDVLDMKGNLQQRHIVAGMEDFLGSGRTLEDGSIEGINKMFREVTGENFDLFETDMRKILGGYTNTVKSSAEITGLMRNLKDDDFVRVLKETGHVDEDFQRILKSRIDDKWDTVAKNTEKLNELQKKAREVLQNTAGSKGSVAKRLLAKEKGLLGEVEELTDDIGKATLVADQLVPLLEQMDTVTAAQLAAAEELNLMMVGGNAATSLVKEQIISFQNTVDALKKQLDSARFDKWQTRVAAGVAEEALQTLDSELQDLGKKLVSNQKMLDALQRYGDSLGPEIERIFRAFRSDSFADDTATVSFGGRMSSSDVGEFIETDQEFNRVIDAVSNPFDTNYLAGPGGEAAGTQGIADAWVQQVVSTEGTPEYELLQSIPDFGARGGKAERVSMGSVRENARAITLQEAREIVIRASLLGDNLEDAADAFYFLTLRELRASELLVVDEAARANARSAFAQELLTGSSERAKSWRTARAQVQRLSQVKQQYDVLASQKTQLGTTTVGGQKIYLSEEGRELIPNLQKQLAELETTPDDPLLAGAYTEALKTLDSLISGSGDAYITVSKASQGLTRFFDLASVKGTLVEGAGLDTAARNRTAVYELVGSFIDENMNINVQSVVDAKTALQAFVREYSINPAKIQMKRAELAEAMNNPLVAQAQYVSQQFALAERTVAATTREVGDVLTNYSIYHNARVAVDYVHRLLPQGVEISDALLRFAFAGSAKQHEKYVRSMEQARSWVASHWAKIESERVGVSASEQAGWLKQRLTSKVVLDENNKEKLVPLSVDELIKLSQVMGDLTLVARKVPRDIQAWRPNQPQWSSHVKKILDLVDPGWDNSMTQQVSDAVKVEARGPSRVGYEQGTGVRAGSRKTSQELGGLSDKTSREMQGAFKIQSEVNNTISNKKKLSPETLIELIEKKRDAGELSSEVASKLIEDTKVLGDSLKAEFKAYKAKIKEETGYSVSELNSVVKALKNSPADTMGMANLWAAATKTRGDGGTRSLRAIDDFFAYLRGGQDVLVSRGGKGSAGGVPETFQVDLADELFGDEVTAGAVSATQRDYRVGGQGSRGTRVVEITDEISTAGKKDADATLKRIYADARKVRKSGIERMAYIAAQLGLDEEDDIVRIIQRAVEADDRMRVLKLRIKGVDAKTKDQLDELVEEHKLVVRRIQKDFDEAVRSTVTGVTRGSMSPDIVKHVSYGDSHLGKMRNALARKISGLQELVFSPEAGLANVDSLRFGVDDLDNGRLSLYRVRYLRGLAEDYRQSIEAYEKAVKAAEKVRPGSKAKKNVVEDFATFREVYGDERKFGQLVRWIEETQNAIDNGYELPVKPFGLKIPKRVEKNLRAIKKAKEKITDVMQSPDFNAAREAEDFYEFLRELADLNIDPKYFPEMSQVRYKYDAVAERALRNQLSVLAGGMSPDSVGRTPQMSVYTMESVNFDGKLMEAFMNASDDIRDLSVVVRTENGYDEIIDNPRAVIDYVRASRKQKFSYSVTETTDSKGRRQITYTDLNGPAGSRDNYVYYVDDYDSREFAPGTDFEIGAARTIRGVGGAQNPPALVGSQTVLDAPIYAWYGAQGILPSASPSNVLRHYSALAAGQPTSVLRYSDVGADGVARKLVVGGNAEAKSKTAVDANDFFHMVDPSNTHVVYDIPSKGHRIIERFDRSGLPLGQTQALLPQEIFFGITNDTIAAAFAREQVAGSRRTTTLLNKLKDLSNRKTELRNSIDEAQYNMRLRQKLLVELDDVETELASVRKELNDGLPEARNAARAAAYNLFERFKQQSVAGFILGRTFDTPDDASAFALEAFKKYAKQLREKKIVHTFESGEVGELYPFNPDLGVADRRKANLSKNWNESPDKKIISQHDALNKAINAASKDLDVVKAGGDAADLAARYADVLEQLRVAERKLALDKSNVATEFYRTVDDSTLNALTKNRDSASEALNVARATQKSAQDAVRAAGQEFIPTAQLRSAESRLERLVSGGASQQEIMNLTSQVAVLRQNVNAALDRRTQLVAQAEEALRKANADVLTQEAGLKEANKQLREAGRQADEGRRNALAMLERDSLDPNKGPMTPDKFDEFVAGEIEKIKEGRVSDFAVSVSTESVDRVVAEGAELSARKEALLSLHPGLQSRYEAARALMDQAEKRYKDLQDQFEKASNTLRNIEAAESRGGALAFGGKNYPAEYAAAKAQQIEARKRVTVAQKRLDELTSQVVKVTAEVNAARSAGAELNTLTLKKDEAVGRLSLLRGALDTLRKETPEGYPSWVKGVLAKDWDAEFEDVSNELNLVFRSLASLPDDMQGKDIDRMWAVWTKVLEARAAVLLSKDDWEYAVQLERMGAAGILNSDNLVWKNLPDDGATVLSDTMSTVLREEPAAGFVKLEGKGSARGFTGLQMRPEVAEILTNMARIRDPQFVRSMRRWLTPYTRFFKSWALATPGFHVRNSITNGFGMIAAGGSPVHLYEAMVEYNKMHRFLRQGKTIQEYLDTITDGQRKKLLSDSYNAMAGSGVGQAEEALIDNAGVLSNNFVTRGSRRAGAWVEAHSRFMLAYDGLKQGLDVPASTARVRKFLFDYEDISKLDAYMRQIIPFWTWTSRNIPLTVTNIYMNPRPYQIYQSFKRNVQDNEKTEALPLYMREAGAFAVAGTGLAATPELGFNRLQADISMLSDPTRVAANVNPLLRVPVETMLANKSFFRNREFNKTPIEAEGPVGTLASLLGAPIGMGQSVGDKRFVDEKLMYGITNTLPLLNQVERFLPSQEYYKQRGTTNPALGFFGAPFREVTDQMLTSEQRRRINELKKLLESQPKVKP